MLFLFRKLRRKLMQKNKVTSYLLYALGEIILVVIGILIALGINNYNEENNLRNEETIILKNLNLEFVNNDSELMEVMDSFTTLKQNCNLILELINQPESQLKKYNIDSLLSETIDYVDYSPSQTVLLDIISSGRLNLLSSDSLRQDLMEWNGLIEKKKEIWLTLDQNAQLLMIPFMIKHSNLKNIDRYGDLNWLSRSKFPSKNMKLFQDPEFENLIDNHLWGVHIFIQHLEKFKAVSDRIIEKTRQENMVL